MRGYITGSSGTSLWTHYGRVFDSTAAIRFLMDWWKRKVERNVLTPTTKSDEHDELISAEEIVRDGWMTQRIRIFALKRHAIFEHGQKLARENGLSGRHKVRVWPGLDHQWNFANRRSAHSRQQPLLARRNIRWVHENHRETAKYRQRFVRLWFRDHCDPYKDETLPNAPTDMLAELSRRYIMLYEMITGQTFQFDALCGDGKDKFAAAMRKRWKYS